MIGSLRTISPTADGIVRRNVNRSEDAIVRRNSSRFSIAAAREVTGSVAVEMATPKIPIGK